jgi:hypothetical protein
VDPQTLFAVAFPLAVPFWALMVLAPGWSVTRRVISSPLIAVPVLLVYVLALLPQLAPYWAAMTGPALPVLAGLLGTPLGATAIWAHLIGYDLLVGRWMYLDSRERGVHPLVMAPVLVLTVLLSPLGLLAYLLLRTVLPVRDRPPAARSARRRPRRWTPARG